MGTENKGGSFWRLWGRRDDEAKPEVKGQVEEEDAKSPRKAKARNRDNVSGGTEAKGAKQGQAQSAPATIRKGIYLSALIYIEGDAPPAQNFNALAKVALADRLASKHDPEHDALEMTLKKVEEKTDVEEDGNEESDAGKDKDKEEKFEF